MVSLGQTVFCSPYQSLEVKEAFSKIQNRIEEYPSIPENLKSLDGSLPAVDVDVEEVESEKDFVQHLVSENTSGKSKHTYVNGFQRFWDFKLKEINAFSSSEGSFQRNDFYLPDYFEHIRKFRLPTVTLWTGLCLGDLRRFSKKYEIIENNNKTILNNNLTNAQVETYFSNLKKLQGLKQPFSTFL